MDHRQAYDYMLLVPSKFNFFSMALNFGSFEYDQVGTVVDSPSDFFAGRLIKKERKATLADELLSDQNLSAYR